MPENVSSPIRPGGSVAQYRDARNCRLLFSCNVGETGHLLQQTALHRVTFALSGISPCSGLCPKPPGSAPLSHRLKRHGPEFLIRLLRKERGWLLIPVTGMGSGDNGTRRDRVPSLPHALPPGMVSVLGRPHASPFPGSGFDTAFSLVGCTPGERGSQEWSAGRKGGVACSWSAPGLSSPVRVREAGRTGRSLPDAN